MEEVFFCSVIFDYHICQFSEFIDALIGLERFMSLELFSWDVSFSVFFSSIRYTCIPGIKRCVYPYNPIDELSEFLHRCNSPDTFENNHVPLILLYIFSDSSSHDILSEVLTQWPRECIEIFPSIRHSHIREESMEWGRKTIQYCTIFLMEIACSSSLSRTTWSGDEDYFSHWHVIVMNFRISAW
jgi:hypothetical protein